MAHHDSLRHYEKRHVCEAFAELLGITFAGTLGRSQFKTIHIETQCLKVVDFERRPQVTVESALQVQYACTVPESPSDFGV